MVASRQSVGSGRPIADSQRSPRQCPIPVIACHRCIPLRGEARQIALHYRRSEEEAFVGGRHWRA